MARVVLISPCCRDVKGSTSLALIIPPIGLTYLAAVLERNNHEVQIIDANLSNIRHEKIIDHFIFKPDLVGLGVNLLTFKEALNCARQIKFRYPDIPIVFGGPHASSQAQYILEQNDVIDAIVIGEGEYTLLEIAESMSKKNIFEGVNGVIYKQDGSIIQNKPRPLIVNLDCLPYPAYHLLPPLRAYKTRSRAEPVGYIFTSRGCPSACTFCYRTFGTTWRPHTPRRVIDEISYLVKTQGIKQIDILDDNFTFRSDRASEILDLIIERNFKLKINLQSGIRIGRINEPLLRKMKKAGVFKIGFGVESGDEGILKIIKKGIQLKKVVDLTKEARSLGIVTHAFYIIGFPEDTSETINRTIDFAIKLNTHFASFSIYTPLPGTELFEKIARENKFLENVKDGIKEGFFSLKVIFAPDYLRPEELAFLCKIAWKKFYMRPHKVLDVISTIGSASELCWLMRTVGEIMRTTRGKAKCLSRIGDA